MSMNYRSDASGVFDPDVSVGGGGGGVTEIDGGV